MIATAATTIPGHYAHAQVRVGGTAAEAIQAADNSQHASFGAGSTGDTATNCNSSNHGHKLISKTSSVLLVLVIKSTLRRKYLT
jgi:hypothetical protein